MEPVLLAVQHPPIVMDIPAYNAISLKYGMEQIVSVDAMVAKSIIKPSANVSVQLTHNGQVIIVCHVLEDSFGILKQLYVNANKIKIGMVPAVFHVVTVKYSIQLLINASVQQNINGTATHA